MRAVLLLAITCTSLLSIFSRALAQSPLDRAHSHNDYQHNRPLLDALDRGFGSIEADIYLVNGRLLVAHDRDSVRTDRTFESMYLAPLRERIANGGGHVYAARPSIMLLIDVKSNADSTWAVLDTLLRRYDDVFTSWHGDSIARRPVIAVISGERPLISLAAQHDRWAGLDGRLTDLQAASATSAAMPIISDDWKRITKWRGLGDPPETVRDSLARVVARAHARGQRVRFWNTPDMPVVWRLLMDSGVDLIGADDLDALREFLSSRTGEAKGRSDDLVAAYFSNRTGSMRNARTDAAAHARRTTIITAAPP